MARAERTAAESLWRFIWEYAKVGAQLVASRRLDGVEERRRCRLTKAQLVASRRPDNVEVQRLSKRTEAQQVASRRPDGVEVQRLPKRTEAQLSRKPSSRRRHVHRDSNS